MFPDYFRDDVFRIETQGCGCAGRALPMRRPSNGWPVKQRSRASPRAFPILSGRRGAGVSCSARAQPIWRARRWSWRSR